MGKATKWLRALLGMKKDKETPVTVPTPTPIPSTDAKEKKRWSFSKPGRDSTSSSAAAAAQNIPDPPTWMRSYLAETEQQQQQNKHAIAVAAATAAAADAAIVAAHAAVEAVRLTNHGKGAMISGGKENLAAVKIQIVFRGYLARKALRALKGLVKLQALVRGFLVRKRAAATLHSMQALIRAQSLVRYQRARRRISKERRSQTRRSMERCGDEAVRINEFHSKRLSASAIENLHNLFDESPMIVEMEGYCKPMSRSRSRRIQTPIYEYGRLEDPYYYPTNSSPLPGPVPGRLSIPESRLLEDFEWLYGGEECRGAATTQSTPRLTNSWLTANAPPTPAKSVCGDSFFRSYSNCPSYMASTESFCAKLRSQSAPKQRPELIISAATAAVVAAAAKKRISLQEMMASRNSFSGVRMNRSSAAQFHEDLNSS